jgi:hypothetical protein
VGEEFNLGLTSIPNNSSLKNSDIQAVRR